MALWSGLLARPAQIPLQARPSLTLYFCLAGAFALTLVPHAVQFPLWVSVAVVVALVLRSVLEVYRLALPSTTLSGFIAIVFFGLIVAQYGTVAGRDAGTALAAGLLAIKFYEIRRPRDIALIIFACFFMVMSSLLYSQVLELFIYCLIMMWILTALLLRLYTGDTRNDRLLPILKTSGIIFAQALPIMLFLFVFFPRYTGNLSFPMGDAKIGLADTVSPGSVAKLAQDDREAMYVHFDSKIAPTADSMYFRALVMWHYAGGVWTPGPFAAQPSVKDLPAAGPEDIVQSFTVLAHNQKWLFALDVPISKPVNPEDINWAEMYNGDVIQLPVTRLNHTSRYTVTSSPFRAEEQMKSAEMNECLQLPTFAGDQIDPGVKALAEHLHEGLTDTQEMPYVYKVLSFFHHGGFVYSTDPGPQGPDWLPEFLLKRKTGFCEHFASAFAVLMRLEHIPTRVVVGYLGGDYNPYSDKWVVSQSNAHAWDEIWIPASGAPAASERGKWQRIDPTAMIGSVEPGQVARADDANDPLLRQVSRHQPTFFEEVLPLWARNVMRETQLRREQVEASWDDLVFSYDPEVQTRLAQAMGLRGQTAFGLLMLCLVTCAAAFFGFRKWLGRKRHTSPVENLYATFCREMAHRGLPRASWEGPLAYTERVAEAFPEDRQALENVGLIVAQSRYGPAPAASSTPEKLKSLLMVLSASQAAAKAPAARQS